MKGKILVIDDDASIRNLYKKALTKEGYEIILSSDGKEGIDILEKENVDIIILDLQMPGMDGFQFLSTIKEKMEELPVIIISTGFGTIENAVKAIRMGASDFIVKPFTLSQLLQIIERNLKMKSLSREVSELKMLQTIFELNKTIVSLLEVDKLLDKVVYIIEGLFHPHKIGIYLPTESSKDFILRKKKVEMEEKWDFPVVLDREFTERLFEGKEIIVEEKDGQKKLFIPLIGKENVGVLVFVDSENRITSRELKFLQIFGTQLGIGIENARLFELINSSYMNAIRSLVNSLEARDPYTKGHSEQVAYYSLLIGKEMGLSEEELEILRNAAYLHDLGKIGIKDEILLKPGPLNEEERNIIKKHPVLTVEILQPLNIRKEEIEATLYHHERVDGKGYPKGLKGDEIPLYAKILAVADAYSAMISERPYRKKMSKEEAIETLKKNAGTQFDKEVVEWFLKAISKKEGKGVVK